PVEPRSVGCGKDTDCKGQRICVRGACIDPPPVADAGPPDGARDAAGDAALQHAVALPGASPLFHVDWAHTGRSRFAAPSHAPSKAARAAAGGVVISPPAIADDGTAYSGSHARAVRAAAPDGTVRWSRPTGDLVWCSPALGPGGALYIGSDDDRLYA